jgi:RNA polymerase sigma-70 factor (ECF subfamily)
MGHPVLVPLPAPHAQLFELYHERLCAHAQSILRDPAEARDVVQEVFIRAMREPRLFDPGFKTGAWLYRVTRNLCFNISRDRRRRGGILAAAPREDSVPGGQAEAVSGQERQQALLAAMDTLSPDHREILFLRYFEDLSYAEIAARLGIKLGTVMSRLSRARDRMEEALAAASDARAAG